MKIKAISKYGFMSETSDVWVKCDRNILNSKLFKELKKGDEITDIMYNPKDFVVSFRVLNSRKDEVEEGVIKPSPTAILSHCDSPSSLNIVRGSSLERGECLTTSKLSSVQDSIRYAQCVNIAFASVNLGGFITEEAGIVYAFDRADKIFEEFNKRVGGN